jgi:hypothetical protein
MMDMFPWGPVLGWVILSGYLLSVSNYLIKWINRKYITKLPRDSRTRKRYQSFVRLVIQSHPYLGALTSTAMLAHLIIQYLNWGFFPSGIVAGSLLLVQGALGGYGKAVRKRKPGLWLKAHRTVAILLFLAIAFHVFTALK